MGSELFEALGALKRTPLRIPRYENESPLSSPSRGASNLEESASPVGRDRVRNESAPGSARPPLTLESLLAADRRDGQGRYVLGKLRFTPDEYERFLAGQRKIGGTAAQMHHLHVLREGEIAGAEPTTPRPATVTTSELLGDRVPAGEPLELRQPSADGRLGRLRVAAAHRPGFEAVFRTALERYPESADLLYKLQSDPRRSFTFTTNDEMRHRYNRTTHTIEVDPRAMAVVGENGARVPPALAALHEAFHGAGSPTRSAVQRETPLPDFDNVEEARVILGGEARAAGGVPLRNDHDGYALPVRDAGSTTPRFRAYDEDENEIEIGPGESLRGSVIAAGKRIEILRSDDSFVELPAPQFHGLMPVAAHEDPARVTDDYFRKLRDEGAKLHLKITPTGSVRLRPTPTDVLRPAPAVEITELP